MGLIKWQALSMYDIADMMQSGAISSNLHKQQLHYYKFTENATMIGKLECARKVVKLRKLAGEIDAYKANLE
jgi:hypothetical protein